MLLQGPFVRLDDAFWQTDLELSTVSRRSPVLSHLDACDSVGAWTIVAAGHQPIFQR